MFKMLAYLKFVLSATNQHGVHSPFVYAFVTRCLYTKSTFKTTKSNSVLLKIIEYFKVKSCQIHSSNDGIAELLRLNYPKLEFGKPAFDLVYFESPQHSSVLECLADEESWHNDTVWFIDQLRQTKAAQKSWARLVQNETITVSIDLFSCGLIFFRKEQVKEHFRIRI